MKKQTIVKGSVLFMSITFLMFSVQNINAQQKEVASKPMPDDLSKIFTHSCMPCHSSKGNVMAKGSVNFDEWNKLTQEKQASRASKISKAVNSGFMPKKSEREKRPDIILTKDQIDKVTKWAESLNPPKK
jgi:hypothetical protein